MSLDQLYLARPLPSISDYRSPIKGLYLCGSGSHPGLFFFLMNGLLINKLKKWQILLFLFFLGGGVMGSPGWNAALTALADLKRK